MTPMTPNTTHNGPDPVEAALSRRLARLGESAVDTSKLDAALRAQLPAPLQVAQRRWLRPLSALAASILILLAVGFGLLQGGREVVAQPGELARMHADIVGGRVPVMKAESIDAANAAIAAMAGSFPRLPGAPTAHAMACCMKDIKNKRVACVLLEAEGVPVTMTVAAAADMASPKSATVKHGAGTYQVEKVDKLSMVMTERNGRWLCLMGEMGENGADALMNLAEKLEF
jgi:hypothetical protein